MKFLVVGLGSMGKRRIRNLQHLNAGTVIGFDIRQDRREEASSKYGIDTYDDFAAAMAQKPEALVISTPPKLHMRYMETAARAGKHFFCEASVTDDGLDQLIELCTAMKIVAAPSCTMRFMPAIRIIQELISSNRIGKILSFAYHSGQYLPDWHSWEDYREYYVSERESGACREIVPFELVWLTWVLGEIAEVSCMKAKLTTLDADIDDTYQLLLRFKNGTLGNMLVDVVSRVPGRTARFISEEGLIEWSWLEKKVRVFTAADGQWTEYREDEGIREQGYVATENMYIDEMKAFLEAMRGGPSYPYTLSEDKLVLAWLRAADQSSDRHIAANPAMLTRHSR
jgi:predicted dehydrogenase